MNVPLVLLNRRRRSGAAAFSPAGLFALAEPGVWYDPSDLTTLFQDTAGTTPVTTPGQTVALALDKSKGLVLGSETVVSPLAGALGSSYSVVGSTIVRNGSTGTALLNAVGGVASATNKTYLVTFTASGVTGDATGIRVGGGTAYGPFSGDGTFTLRVVGGGVSGSITFIPWSGGAATATYSNISVKELPGFHATQATLASRPTYGIVPLGGRRNLLTYSEAFDNAVWNTSGITYSSAAGFDGVTKNALATINNVGNRIRTNGNTVLPNTQYTFSFYAKLGTATGNRYAVFDVTNATLFVASVIYDSQLNSSTYTRVSVTFTTPAGCTQIYPYLMNGNTTTGTVFLDGAQLETGSSATAYQRVTTGFDVTEAGVASLSYLSCDGVDDFMVTPTITPGIDKAQVFAGVRKLSDAAGGVLVENSAAVVSNAGAFAIFAPSSAAPNYLFRSRGSAAQVGADYTNALVAAPTTNVLSGIGDISGDLVTLRVNGTQVAQGTADQGTGNYLAYPIYIGRRGGTTNAFNGQIFSLIVRFGTNLDAGTITSTEVWVNGKTGAYA